jgi:peptidoglycan/LPS O-acetylase OafA/YrhL
MATIGPPRRLDLDGLRGVAIAFILIEHFASGAGFYPLPGSAVLARFLHSLWSGVDIFFVLSGFLIGGIILDNGHCSNFYKVFYSRRALRIWPVAFFTIAFAYLVIPLLNLTYLWYAQTPPYAYVLLINNFWTASGLRPYAPLTPMWSLAIEEQFYLLCPALMLAASSRVRVCVLTGIVLASPILRYSSHHFSPWDFTLLRLDGFAAGILVAEVLRNHRYRAILEAKKVTIDIVTMGVILAALLYGASPRYTVITQTAFGVSLNSLAAAGVILKLNIHQGGMLSRSLAAPPLVMLGRMSYFVYLMHLPILACVMTLDIPVPLQPPVALALCLLYAWASWRWPEAYLIGLGKRLSYRLPANSVGVYGRSGPPAR